MRIFFILSLLALYSLQSQAKENLVQAIWVCDRQQLTEGDSCTVALVLLSPQRFSRVQSSVQPKVKGGKFRKLPEIPYTDQVRRRSPQGRGYVLLNRLVYARFTVKAGTSGRLSVEPMKIKVSLNEQEISRSRSSGREKTKERKVTAVTDKWMLPVVEKPQKTTRELMQHGGFL